jgi:hypothetical protein
VTPTPSAESSVPAGLGTSLLIQTVGAEERVQGCGVPSERGIHFFWWPQSGQWYAFWSSFGAYLNYFAVIGVAYRHLKCQSCWRVAHHQVEGTHFKTCHKYATVDAHARLVEPYRRKFPEQHKFFTKGVSKPTA